MSEAGLFGLLHQQAEAAPQRAAIVAPNGQTTTFSALAQGAAARARAYARAGIGLGDRVLVARGVSPALYETLLGLFRLGAVAVFPEPAAGLAGLAQAIEATRPKAMAAGLMGAALRPFVPALQALPLLPGPQTAGPVAPSPAFQKDAPALITFTSGSTGRPKGIVRSVGFLLLQHRLIEHLRQTEAGEVDLISLPVFVLSNLAAGATSVIPRGPLRRPARLRPADLVDQIRAYGVRRVVAPPAVCARLVESGAQLPGLTRIFTGGGPVYPNLLRRLQETAPSAKVFAVYGSTEAEPIAHLAADDIAAADWRAMAEGAGLLAGHPIAEISVRLVDGELQVRGPHVNSGYLDPRDDAKSKVREGDALWHRTGDAGRLDDAGRIWLLGRAEAVEAGLYPFAVETAAMSWPGVRQAAFLGGGGQARLAIAGDESQAAVWRRAASGLGPIDVVPVRAIPLDKRHNSKVDYAALRAQLAKAAGG